MISERGSSPPPCPAFPPFAPHPLFASAAAQTLAAALVPRRFDPALAAAERRTFRVDDTTRVLALCHWQPQRRACATLVLLHGLTGSADSSYLRGTASKARRCGFNVVRLNLRNCGATEHLTPTLYHSGLTDDLAAVLRELVEADGLAPPVVGGFSLGGNIALKLAGELADAAPRRLSGVVAVSPPIDLAAASAAIGRGFWNRIYERRFLANLRATLARKATLFPDRYDRRAGRLARTLYAFDDQVTAKHFGFGTASRYYEEASALALLPRVTVPAWILSARDDSLIPPGPLERTAATAAPSVHVELTDHGGHVGFLGAAPARAGDEVDLDAWWAENRVVQFARAAAARAGAS